MASAETFSQKTTVESLLKKVQQLAPIIKQYARDSERERRLATPVAEALRAAGLYRLWRPKTFGGFELDPVSAFRVLEEVSTIDTAAGWNLQLSNGFDFFGAWFEDDAAKEIFGQESAILAGSFNPPRKATRLDTGYKISGRTPFVSGAHQATVFFGLANVFSKGEMQVMANGLPETVLSSFLPGDAEIVDNWNTMGMCGTGSHDVSLNEVFVPEGRAPRWTPLQKPGSAYEGPLYRLSIWPAIAALSAPALGNARATIDNAMEVINRKAQAYTTRTLRDRSVVQAQLAQARARLDSARAYLFDVFQNAWEEAVSGRPITLQLKGGMQLAATNAVLEAARAVDLVHAIVGASGIREEYAFARHFRDAHVMTQHGFINESKFEAVGQIMLGLEPEWPFFLF